MNDIYQEFECQLALWQARYASRPEHEILCLYLLALEREENVAVAYDEKRLAPRLAAACVPDDVRDLMRHALLRVWEDEKMHAIYVRAMLLRLDAPLLGARAFLRQAAGIMGGWTVAVRQHLRWSEAPLSRAVATVLLWVGCSTGRVPRSVRTHLDCCSFRDFCRYNADTETTAWLCWRRLAELAARVPALSSAQADDYHRIALDEERHRQVFRILAAALTAGDGLREGVTFSNLSARIGTVGEPFLPNRTRFGSGSSPRGWAGIRTDGSDPCAKGYRAWTGRTSTTPQRIERSRAT